MTRLKGRRAIAPAAPPINFKKSRRVRVMMISRQKNILSSTSASAKRELSHPVLNLSWVRILGNTTGVNAQMRED
jgi:hypothetical protein